MPHARVNGLELYYEVTGQGRPVVLAHGFSATCRMWDGQVAAFRDRYRLIVYDARGQGRSEVPEEPAAFSQPRMVEDLRQLLHYLGVPRACVGGLSMGGNVALNFALEHPEMVDGLLVCDTGAGSDEPEHWAGKVRRWVHLLTTAGVEAFAADYIEDPIMAHYARRGATERDFLWRAMTSNTAEGLARGLAGVVGNRPSLYALKNRLQRVAVPTTIVVGDHDDWCTKVSGFLAETIPNAELALIRNSGHMTNLEQPDQFNDALGRFLAGVDARDKRSNRT
jgi:pimeloyl-ACP methyl ester carboxylesterase